MFVLPLSNVLNSFFFPDLFVAVEMGVTSRPLLLVCAYLAAALIGGTRSEGVCLQDGKHKAAPGPEPHLRECGLYADSECVPMFNGVMTICDGHIRLNLLTDSWLKRFPVLAADR